MILRYIYENPRAKPELAALIKIELDARWERIVDTAERVARKKYRQRSKPVIEEQYDEPNNRSV